MADEISLEITETITKVEVTEDVTSINITPNITSVELKGISISNAGSATAMSYAGESNTLGYGSTVAASLDHINANGLNKTDGGTVAGAIDFTNTITFTGAADFNNTVSFASNIDTDLALDSTKRITWGSTGSGNLQYKFIKGTNGANLELGTGTTTTMFISNNGSVGIGVEIPTSKLDVDGEITGTALDINGNADVSGSITATSADINGDITVGGDITLDGWPKSDYELKGDVDGSIRFAAVANEDLDKGDIVYIVTHGSQGSETRVAKAQSNSASTMPAFGLALNDVTSGNAIQVVTFGNLYGQGGGANQLDTSDYDSGTTLYVSADTAGAWTNTPPAGESNFIQNIGKVVRKQKNNGVIKVGGAGRINATPNLNDGNIFIGNSSNISTAASFDTTFGTSLATRTTTDLTEGDNEYYTSAKVDARVNLQTVSNLDLSQKTTSDLTEGANEYYTDAKVGTYISGDRSYGNITTTGYLRGPSTFTIDPAGHGDNTGKVVIAGDLQVDGTTTTINSTELTIDDKVIEVASNATNTGEADGAGLSVGGTSATLTYTALFDGWTFNKSVDLNGNLLLSGGFFDSNNSNGTAGQALLSTGTATEWGNISTTLNVEADSGDTQAIEMLTENLDIAGGTGISTATTDNTVTVTLDDTAVTAGTYGAAETIPQITVDEQGRITSVNNLTGNSGPRGAHAATTFDYKFSLNDAASNNPSTYLSLSSYDYTASDLKLSVNYTDNNSNDLTDLIREVTTVNSHITLINNADPEKFLILKITDAHRSISVGSGAYESLVVSVERVVGVSGSGTGTVYEKQVAGLAVGDGTELPSQPYITAAFSKAGELAAVPAGSFNYTNNYDTVLGITQHVSGGIAFNNWDYEAATSISLSKTDLNSNNVESLIEDLLGSNALPIKALITITNQLNPSKYVTFEVDTISGFNAELTDFFTVAIDYKSGITGKDSNGDTTDAAGLVPLYGVGPGPLVVSILKLPNRSTIDTTGIVYGVRYSNVLTETLPSGQIAFSSHTYTSANLQIKLNSTSNENVSVKDFIRNSATSTATPKGHLRLTSLVDNEHALFEIDGIADSTSNDYTTLDLTHISGSTGNVALTTKDLVVVSLQNAADVGSTGVDGANAALTLQYDFSASTGYTDPASGYLQFNRWDYTLSGMRVGISNIDGLGNDLTSTIRHLTSSTNPDAKGYLTVVKKDNRSLYVVLKITNSYYLDSESDHTLFSVERIAGSEGGSTSGSGIFPDGSNDVLVTFQRAADFGDIDTALGISSASDNEVLSWTGSAYDWVAQSGGIALSDISVNGTEGTADGDGGIAYDNSTGVFTYTPPDLSTYLTSYTETDPIVGGIDGIVKSNGAGIISAAVGGTSGTIDYSTVKIGDGATDALAGNTAILALGTTATTALAGDTKIEELYTEVDTGLAGVVVGKAYRISGWDSTNNRPVVTPALATSSLPVIGFATETVAANETTKLLVKGLLTDIDTSLLTMGGSALQANLFPSSTTAGLLTRVPNDDNSIQSVASVVVLSTNNGAADGVIMVDVSGPQHFKSLAEDKVFVGNASSEPVATDLDSLVPKIVPIFIKSTVGNTNGTDFKALANKRIVIQATGSYELFQPAAVDVGKTWTLYNTSSGTIILDFDSQFVDPLTGQSKPPVQTDWLILSGGIVELVCINNSSNGGNINTPNFLIYGTGLVDL